MVDFFHWSIFLFHFVAALVLTFAVWYRCDQDVWVSRVRVDTYKVQNGSAGLWWHDRDEALVRECSVVNGTQSKKCFNADLPLYERDPPNLGWHIFVLLGHFEWISSAFAFFYIKHSWSHHSWTISSLIALTGTLLFMPYKATVFVNEVFLLWVNWFVTVSIFTNYRSIHRRDEPRPQPPSNVLARFRLAMPGHNLSGEGNLVPTKLVHAQLPALRFCEYCITASELWVAVLCVFVQDPPAFMTLGGYTLILLTNLYGLLLHYSLVSDNMQTYLAASPQRSLAGIPPLLDMQMTKKPLRVPYTMLGLQPAERMGDAFRTMMQRRVWGSYIASNTSTLLNSWLAYLVSIAIIFYQQTFLFSSEPPVFVVFAGWSLLLSYSSFGIWVTLLYWFPEFVTKLCCCAKEKELYVLEVYGLDILSLSAKLSIVGSLSYGFVFREQGRC